MSNDYDEIITFATTQKVAKDTVIPKKYFELFDSPYVVIIQENNNNEISVLPSEYSDIYLMRIIMKKMNFDTLKAMNVVLKKARMNDMVFTIGVCTKGEHCFHECYFSASLVKMPLDELRESLMNVEGINDVIIEKVRT